MSKTRKGGRRTAYLLHFFPPGAEDYYVSTTGYQPSAAHDWAHKHLERKGTPGVPYSIEQQRPDTLRGPWPSRNG